MAMPATTTLKLPDNLKKRIAPLADSAGKTPHAWMVEAIEAQATLAEKRKAFVADARAAEEEVERTGLVYRAADVHRYVRARAAGKKAPRPKLVKR
jgi:predicted transcriptional regulator